MRSTIRKWLKKLRARYGLVGAIAIAVAMGILALVPIPGLVFVPLAVAELVVRIVRARHAGLAH